MKTQTMYEPDNNASRYAIYFSPRPDALLFATGSAWLGRDAISGAALDPALPDHIRHEDWLRATESPRRYGFHATLKPPFRIAEGETPESLRQALRDFAREHSSFVAPRLCVSTLAKFLALTLSAPSEEFHGLAAACVSEFDRFRASSSQVELDERMRGPRTAREREHILRWGYPYVFDTWKFHMSLTSSMAPESLQLFEPYLRSRFAEVCAQPLHVDSVCLFYEPTPGAPFHLLDRASLRSV